MWNFQPARRPDHSVPLDHGTSAPDIRANTRLCLRGQPECLLSGHLTDSSSAGLAAELPIAPCPVRLLLAFALCRRSAMGGALGRLALLRLERLLHALLDVLVVRHGASVPVARAYVVIGSGRTERWRWATRSPLSAGRWPAQPLAWTHAQRSPGACRSSCGLAPALPPPWRSHP